MKRISRTPHINTPPHEYKFSELVLLDKNPFLNQRAASSCCNTTSQWPLFAPRHFVPFLLCVFEAVLLDAPRFHGETLPICILCVSHVVLFVI